MSASFPTSVKTFTSRSAGQTIASAIINDLQDEVNAIETTLLPISAGQVAFPATQNPSANANTLDDYEEGTWTPSLGGTTTYTAQTGTYTKIGRVVHARGLVQVLLLGSGSATTISGLPFASTDNYSGVVGSYTSVAASVASIACYTSLSTLVLTSVAAAGSASMNNPATVFANGATVHFNVTYFV